MAGADFGIRADFGREQIFVLMGGWSRFWDSSRFWAGADFRADGWLEQILGFEQILGGSRFSCWRVAGADFGREQILGSS